MEITSVQKIGRIAGGQDGAIFNRFLFRFNSTGLCRVFKLDEVKDVAKDDTPIPFASFTLDKADVLFPHSNAVTFGAEKYDEKDEFPLLYCNVYNSYAKEEDKHEGECLVYRITRNETEFFSQMVQIIKIGFTEDKTLWRSPFGEEKRPYGNFTIDCEKGILYAFNMLMGLRIQRYFAFRLPKVDEGVVDPAYGVKKLVLNKEDILDRFDCEFHHFVQGACCHEGLIYSTEGFTNRPTNPPALRIIDPQEKRQLGVVQLEAHELYFEPEMIDFEDGKCYFSDCHGTLYVLDFKL